MRKILLLTTLFFGIGLSSAQVRFEGKLISAKTKLELPKWILVKIVETNESALTDSTGCFTFSNLDKNRHYTLESISTLDVDPFKFEFETENDSLVKRTFEVKTNCGFDDETAKIDWGNKKAKLYIIGSIAPIKNSKADEKFEKKYKIKYHDFGCTPSVPTQCIIEYNREILSLLQKEYGEKWKSKIRNDVVVK